MATHAPALNTLKLEPSLCINCGTCIDVCPHGVFGPGPDSVVLVNPGECMECGACQRNCPTSALSVDAGVGCASAMIRAAIFGGEPTCGDSCCGGSAEAGACNCKDSGASQESCCGGGGGHAGGSAGGCGSCCG